jgi:peptide/nickel transport system permease protein
LLAFLVRRLLLMIPTTLGVALVVFAIYHAAPGDPAQVMMGMGGSGEMGQDSDTEARIDSFRREFGLDRSLAVQFLNYVGPINFMRDGHAWFTTPYTERTSEEVDLAEGGEAVEGRPLAIERPPGTEKEAFEPYRNAARALARGEGLDPLLAENEELAYPALFSELFERYRLRIGDAAKEVERLTAGLAEISGAEVDLSPSADESARSDADRAIARWFGWYYTQGGGYRVRNTGERPWGGLLALDLGKEMQSKTPVIEELRRRLAVTVPLALVSTLLAYLIALPLGIFSVRRQGTKIDGGVTVGLFVLYSIPTFWAGLMLILLMGKTTLGWLPVIGLHDKDAADFGPWMYAWDTVLHSILPVVTLTYGSLAYLSRQMRAGMLEVIRQDYIRTARAKGLAENVVIYKHALRNSMIPVLTLLASILPILIGGSIIVEAVFDLPGMGKYAFEGLLRRDFYIIMATTIFVGIMTQIGILLSDITYSLVDPRIRHN